MERKYNRKKMFDNTKGILKNKFVLSSLFLISILIFTLSVSYVLANSQPVDVTIVGDLPHPGGSNTSTIDYVVSVYDGPAPSGTAKCSMDNTTGHFLGIISPKAYYGDSYNDNDDYNLSFTAPANADLYVYYCRDTGSSGDLLAEYRYQNLPDNNFTLVLDLGKVHGVNVHADLYGYRAWVCDELNGRELSNVENTNSKVTAGGYQQYYVMDEQVTNNTIYLIFDSDVTGTSCDFDASVDAGKRIRIDKTQENYGVYVGYEPDTKISTDLHDNIATGRLEANKKNDGTNVGLTYVEVTDCFDDGNDDQPLYYENPISVEVIMGLYGPGQQNTSIYYESAGFTQQDAVVRVYGQVPTTIDSISMNDGTLTYETSPDASGNYDLYVKDNFNSNLSFSSNGTVVYSVPMTIPDTTNDTCINLEVTVAMVSGEAHSDMETGNDIMAVYSDAICTQQVSYDYNPSNVTGDDNDYVIYFTATGLTDFYLNSTMNDSGFEFSSCGNHFQLDASKEKHDHNITAELWGHVTDGSDRISRVEIYHDLPTMDVYTDDTEYVSGSIQEYHIFAIPDDDTTSNVYFYNRAGNIKLNRTKDLTTTTDNKVPLHTARVYGDLDPNFASNRTGGRIYVYDEYQGTEILNSVDTSWNRPYLYNANGNKYAVFFEVTNTTEDPVQGVLTDGEVQIRFEDDNGFYTWRTEVDGTPSDPGFDYIVGGDDMNIDLVNVLTGDTQVDINDIRLVDGNWTPVIAETDSSDPKQYVMYYDDLDAVSGNWSLVAHINPLVLMRDQGTTDSEDLDGTVFNVAKLQGETYTSLENDEFGNARIEVYANFDSATGECSGLLSSEVVNPNDNATDADFNQYFQAADSSYDSTNYYIRSVGKNNSVLYSTCGNGFQTQNLGGEMNITVDKGGMVPDEMTRVAIDYNQDGTDDASTTVIDNEYHLWATTDTDGVTLRFYNASNDLIFETSLPSLGAGYVDVSVSKVQGDVPVDFEGDLFYLENITGDGICGSGDETDNETVVADVSGSPDYKLYFVDDGRDYNVLFCEGATLELIRNFTSPTQGNQTVIKHVAKLNGSLDEGYRAASAGNESIFVYDAYPGLPLNSHNTINDGGAADDSYHVFFESTTLTAGDAEAVFKDQNTPGNNEYVVRYDLDDNINNGVADGVTPGSIIELNMNNTITGVLADSINELHIAAERTPVKLFVTGNWEHNYVMYYDSTAATQAWSLDVYDSLYSNLTLDLVLSREKGSAGDLTDVALPKTFNVSKVTGEAHPDLEDATEADDIQIFGNNDCTNQLSSEARQPIDDEYINGIDDYMQYYEDVNAGTYYMQVTAGLTDGDFVTCGNAFASTPGDTVTEQNITVEKKGNVTSDIVRIGADLNQNGTDYAVTEDVISQMYHLFTQQDGDVNVHYYNAGGLVFTIANEDWSVAGTYVNNVDALIGDVDTNLDGGEVLLFNVSGKFCNDTDYLGSSAILSNGSSPDYMAHMKADGTRYYAVFCDATADKVFEWKVDSSTTGGNIWTMDVGEVVGEAHPNLEDGADFIEIYDSDGITCDNTTKLSTELVSPADDAYYSGADYAQFFLQRLNDSADQLDYQDVYCKKIVDDDTLNSGNVYVQWEIFESAGYGSTETNDLDAMKYGLVVEESVNASMEDILVSMRLGNSTGVAFSWTSSVSDGTYRMYGTDEEYDLLYEKTGWVDQQIDDEMLNSTVDTENNITMPYTVKIKGYDELMNDKPGFELNITENGTVSTCVEGDDNQPVNTTGDCDADDSEDSIMFWAYSPGDAYGFNNEANVNVDIKEYLPGYVYQYNNSVTVSDSKQYYQEFYNPFTIRVVDVFNELGYKLNLSDVADEIGEVSITPNGTYADPTGINVEAGNSSVYGDPRGEADNDVFLPLTEAQNIIARAPGYVTEDIFVTPNPNYQQTVMFGDYDRNCTELENSVDLSFTLPDYTEYADYCDNDEPQRVDGDGLLYTLKIHLEDELSLYQLPNASILMNSTLLCQVPTDGSTCGDNRYVDYDYDPEGNYYIAAIPCTYDMSISKGGYITRAASGVYPNPDLGYGDLTLTDVSQTRINASGNVTCNSVFTGTDTNCSGMPYTLKIKVEDQADNTILGATASFNVVNLSIGGAGVPILTDTFVVTDGNQSDYDMEANGYIYYPLGPADVTNSADLLSFLVDPFCSPFELTASTIVSKPGYAVWQHSLDIVSGVQQVYLVTENVDNVPSDVHITSPEEGDLVSGMVQIVAEVAEDGGSNTSYVEFYHNGMLIGNDSDHTDGKWNVFWNATAVATGEHNLTAISYDLNMLTSESDIVTVVVDNINPLVFNTDVVYPTEQYTVMEGQTVLITADVNETDIDEVVVDCTELGDEAAVTMSTADGVTYTGECTLVNTTGDYSASVRVIARDNSGNIHMAGVQVTVDNTAPTAQITAPVDGSIVTGVINVATFASDDNFEFAELYISSDLYLTTLIMNDSNTLNTSEYSDGDWILTLKAYDDAGHVTVSDGIHITIDNTAPDDVVIVRPDNGEYVTGVYRVDVSAGDVVEAVSVTLYDGACGGSAIATDVVAPWSFDWNTTSEPEGAHTLCARATDIAGHTTDSNEITVIVDNTRPAITGYSVEYPTGQETVKEGQTVTIHATVNEDNVDTVTVDCTNLGDEKGVTMSEYSSGEWSGQCTLVGTSGDSSEYVTVWVTDKVGKIWTFSTFVQIDNFVPIASIDSPADDSILTGTVTVDTTAEDPYYRLTPSTDNLELVEFYVGTDLYATSTSTNANFEFNTTDYSDGDWILTIKAYDDAGHVTVSDGIHITIDNTAPEDVVIVRPDNGEYVTGVYRVDVSAGDTVEAVSVTLYDGVCGGSAIATDVVAPWSFDWNTTSEPEGAHTLCARATDIGSHTTDSDLVNVIVDNMDPSAPALDVNDPDSNGCDTDGDVTLTWTEPTDGIGSGIAYYEAEVSMDPTFVSGVSESGMITELFASFNDVPADGTWYARVRAIDNVGHESVWSNVESLIIDRVAPVVVITAPAEGSEVAGIVSVSWTSGDSVADELSIDGDAFFSATSAYSWNTTTEEEGAHTLSVRATDSCGNVGSDEIIVQVDNTPECIAFTMPNTNELYTADVDAEVTAPDFTSSVEFSGCGLSATTDSDGSDGWTMSLPLGTGDGSCTVTAEAFDELGNSICSRTIDLDRDNTDPTEPALDVNDPDSNGCDTDGDITLTWTAGTDDYGIAYYEAEVSMDPTFVSGVSESGMITELFASFNDVPADGTWYARVRAIDNVGHESVWSNVESLIIDRVAPVVVITAPAEGSEVAGIVSVSWTSGDSVADELSIDGDAFFSATSAYSWNTTTEEEGAHTLSVRATDSCGNVGSDEIIVQVDNTPECLAFISPVDGEWYTEDQAVEVTSSDDTSRVDFSGTCGVDLSSDDDGSDGWTTNADLDTDDGSCTIIAEAFDELGNSICSKTMTVNRDNTAPNMTDADVADANSNGFDEDGIVTVTYLGNDATGIGVDYYHVTVTHTGTSQTSESDVTELFATFADIPLEGEWCAEVYAVDELGNEGSAISAGCIVVDRLAPTEVTVSGIDVEDEPYDTNNDYEITWTVSTDDNGIASYDIMINGDITEGVSAPLAQNPGDGTYNYKVRAIDNAGNVGEWSNTYTVIVDTQAPDVMIVNPENDGFTTSELTLSVVNDENSECDYNWTSDGDSGSGSLDGDTTTHEASLTLPEGSVEITVTCEDMAGHVGTETVEFVVTNDLPQTSSTVVDPYYTSSNPTITAQVESQNSPIEVAKYCLRRPHEPRPARDAECVSFNPQDGEFDEMKETVEHVIDISGLEEGIWVAYTNALDAVDWGEYDAELFIVDRIAPIIDEQEPIFVKGDGECEEDFQHLCVGQPDSCEETSSSWPDAPQDKCEETFGCEWNSELLSQGCEGTPDTTCESLGDIWGETKCLETDGCSWDSVVEATCDGTPSSCSGYVDETECGLFDGCNWITGQVCTGTPATDSCDVLDQTDCNAVSGCSWTFETATCIGLEENQCGLTDGCGWQPQTTCTMCVMYTNESSCLENAPSCGWSASNGCYDKTESPCLGIVGLDNCDAIETCSWYTEYSCYPTGGISTCQGTPDSCSELYGGSDSCDNGCSLTEATPYCEGVPTATCAEIHDISKENGYSDYTICGRTEGCYSDQEVVGGTCNGTPQEGACSPYDNTQCEGITGCTWNEEFNYSCEGTPDDDSCNVYSMEQCQAIPGCSEEFIFGWDCSGSTTFEISVETNEDAYCEYSLGEFTLGSGIEMQGQWTDQHIATVTVDADGTYVYHVICADYAQHQTETTITSIVDSVMDDDAPIVVSSAPEGTVNNSNVLLSIETDEYAICEYATTQFDYGEGMVFDTTGSTVHMQELNLADGVYAFYVKCEDFRGNEMTTSEEVIFEIDTMPNFAFGEWLYPTWDSFTLPKFILDDILGDENHTVDTVLASVQDSYEEIYYYDGTDWKVYFASGWGNLHYFDDDENRPYWIKMNEKDRLELNPIV